MTASRQLQTAQAFRDELDERNADIWEAIFDLPFLAELRDSSLPRECFSYFIAQDLLYLDEFARVLAVGAARSEGADAHEMFLRHATSVSAVEQELHTSIMPEVGLDPSEVRRGGLAPVTAAYTDHMQRVAHSGQLAEIVAAVLPCYDVYRRVGERLSEQPPGDALYSRWVASYSSPEFASSVEEQLALLDRLAAESGDGTRELMAEHYRKSIRYEWMFWQQAHDRLGWPVGAAG